MCLFYVLPIFILCCGRSRSMPLLARPIFLKFQRYSEFCRATPPWGTRHSARWPLTRNSTSASL